jgi:protein transport protein SEC31
MILGNYQQAVELCIKEDRWTDAILIANCFDQVLLAKTQNLYFKKNQNKLSHVIFLPYLFE